MTGSCGGEYNPSVLPFRLSARRHRGWSPLLAVAGLALVASDIAAMPTLDDARQLQASGHCREAVPLYQTIAAASRQAEPATAGIALNNACLCLSDLGEGEAALVACEEALALRRGLDDPRRLARSLNNTGRVLLRLGRYDRAAERIREALDINRAMGDVEGEVLNLGNLGVVAIYTGRYGEALDLNRRAEAIASAHADAPWSAEQRRMAILNEGVVLERLGAFDEALERYEQLRKEGDELPPRNRAALIANVGILYRHLGDPVRAAASVREAARLSATVEDVAGLANAELNLGIILHYNLGQLDAAEEAYRTALRLTQNLGEPDAIIESALNLGSLLLTERRFDEALEQFRLARHIADASGSADGLVRALAGLGRLRAATGDLVAAREHLERAMTTLEGVRAGLDRAALRAQFLRDRRSVFGSLVQVLAALADTEPGAGHEIQALEVVQRAKHRALLEAVGRGSDLEPARAEQLQRAAGDGVIVEYFFTEDHLFRWLIERHGVTLTRLASARELDPLLREVHRELAAGGAPRPTVMERLAERLLAGVDLDRRSHIYIAPDGLLHYLPFEALDLPARPGSILLDLATVAYLPSASLLTRGQAPAPHALRLLALGAPAVPAGEEAGSPRSLISARFALQPLRAAELDAIGSAIGGRQSILRGADATEARFRAGAAAGTSILHLATHTLVDERMDARAAVLLAPSGSDDGLLYPDEIAATPLHVDLTLLAACSTALGTEDEGRGIASLTGSFLAAGSRAVIATLWDVEDGAAAVFMEQLYHQLGRGLSPAEALRRTKQRMRRHPSWRQPSLWAAYVLVGDAPAVAGAPLARRWQAWLGLLLPLSAALWWLLLRRQGASGPTVADHSEKSPSSNPPAKKPSP